VTAFRVPSGNRTVGRILQLIGPLILVFIFWNTKNTADIWQVLWQASPVPLLLALTLNVVVIHLKLERWRLLLSSQGKHYSMGRAYPPFLASLFLGLATPGRVGDVVRVQYVHVELELPYSKGFAVAVADRIADALALIVFICFALVHFAGILSPRLAGLAVAGSLSALAGSLLIFVPGLSRPLLRAIFNRLPSKSDTGSFERFISAIETLTGKPFFWSIIITIAAFAVNYLQGWLLAYSLGIDLSFMDVTAILAIATFLSLLPVSISGLGVRELYLALLFPTLALTAAQGVAYGLAVFAVMYLALLVPGFFAWQLAPPPIKFPAPKPNQETGS
jgi:uncharacterized protein (TIRG00374 family)